MKTALLRRLLLASGSTALLACGGRADLADQGYDTLVGVEVGEAGGSSSGGQAGQGGAAGKAGAAGKGGAAGKAGAAGSVSSNVCDNPDPLPTPVNGFYDCGPSGGISCQLRCYVPGVQTLPGNCRDLDDPALAKLPVFSQGGCDASIPVMGPYCGPTAEKFAGAKPVCCYLGAVQGCAGRPLRVEGSAVVAPLRRGSWG